MLALSSTYFSKKLSIEGGCDHNIAKFYADWMLSNVQLKVFQIVRISFIP